MKLNFNEVLHAGMHVPHTCMYCSLIVTVVSVTVVLYGPVPLLLSAAT